MADAEACNGVAAADIEAVNGVAKADIEAINGVEVPSGSVTATRWGVAMDDGYVSWANAADIAAVATWEDNVYRADSGMSADFFDIAFGKDGSGNAKWMVCGNSNADNITFDGNNDITDESAWTSFEVPNSAGGAKVEVIEWGAGDGESDSSSGSAVTRADAWLASGRTSSGEVWVHRSVDGGANWTHLNLDGLTNITGNTNNDYHLRAMASDGTGNWMIAQRGNLYFSSDSGVSFSYLVQPTGNGTHLIRDIVYTNSTWVVLSATGGNLYLSACAGAAATDMDDAANDWSNAVQLIDGQGTPVKLNGNNLYATMAGAGGRIVAIDHGKSLAATVNGKTDPVIQGTTQTIPDSGGSSNCIATDGTTWLVGSDGNSGGGDICRSTDGGASWSLIVDGINESGDRKIEGIAPNVVLPL